MSLPRADIRALEKARRLTALQVDTLTHAVESIDDTVGWSRLTELGTASTVRGQEAGVSAAADALNAALEAVDLVGDLTPDRIPIQPGRLASGRDVRGMFAATQDIVARRMTGGATFPEALDASAKALTGFAASEPHRVARDGMLAAGLGDPRFNRYRRVAVGNTCTFCLMLATRGAVYLTAASAGQGRRYHHMCDCYVELVVDEAAIERSKALQGDWRNAVRDPEGRMEDVGAWRPGEFLDPTPPTPAPRPAQGGGLPAGWARRETFAGRVAVDGPSGLTVEADAWGFHGVEIGTKFADEFSAQELQAVQDAVERVARDLDRAATVTPLANGTKLTVSVTRSGMGPDVGGLTSVPMDLEDLQAGLSMKLNARLFDPEVRAKWVSAAEFGKVQPGVAVDPLRATVTHEYGHAFAIAKGGVAGGHETVAARALAPILDDTPFHGFSQYGQTNIHETYAEAFAEWAMRADLGGEVHPVTAALARVEGWP